MLPYQKALVLIAAYLNEVLRSESTGLVVRGTVIEPEKGLHAFIGVYVYGQ